MRKLFATMLVFALMLSAVGVSASTLGDVAGTEYEDSVLTLTSLGLVTGFPDGTYRPDDTVTRAQFAALAVRALGLEELESYSRGATKFPDVAATHWASGYINIATDQELISGYTDGTFRPENPVTGAEALAMLIRVLGYEPVVRGSWPTNYLVKAFELGISRGVDFAAGAPASRGVVALLVDNALEVELMKPDMTGDVQTYKVAEGTSLLSTKLGYEPVVGRVVETGYVLDTDLETDEVVLALDGEEEEYTLAAGLDVADYLGYEIRAYQSGGQVVRYQVLPATVVSGTVDEAVFETLTVEVGGDEYVFADDVVDGYYNLVRTNDAGLLDVLTGGEIDLFLVEGEIAFFTALDYEDSVIITALDDRFERITGRDSEGTAFSYADDLVIVKDSEQVEFDALETGDVFHYFENADVLYMEVVTDQVAGFIAEAYSASGALVVVVDGEDYTCAAKSTLSSGLDAGFSEINEDNLIGYVGADVVLYLDRDGSVRHIVGDVEEEAVVPDEYVIVVREPYEWEGPDGTEVFIRVRHDDGTVARYTITDEDIIADVLGNLNYDEGAVLIISVDEDGIVDSIDSVLTPLDVTDTVSSIHPSVTAIVVDGKTHKVDNVIIFSFNAEGSAVVDVEDLLAANDGFDVAAYDAENLFLSVILLDKDDLAITEDPVDQIGIITRRYITADGPKYTVLTEDGTVDCFLPEGGSEFSAGDLVEFECIEGTIDTIDLPEYLYSGLDPEVDYVYYVVSYNADSRVLQIAEGTGEGDATQNLLVDPDVVIFDGTDSPVLGDEDLLVLDAEIKLVVVGNIVTYIKVIDN